MSLEIFVQHVSKDGEVYGHWLSLASLRASGGFTVELPAGTLRVEPFSPEEAARAAQ